MQSSENFVQPFDSYLDSLYAISHSAQTVNCYKTGLKHFRKFVDQNYHCTEIDLITRIKNQEVNVFKVLQEFIIYLDKLGKKPASIKLWVTVARGYLGHIGIRIYSEDFRHSVKLPKKVRQREEPLTKDILVRLLRNLPPKIQTAVLVATASGMRIGEIVQLKISNVDFDSKPTKIRIRAEITKTKESRETYLTSEATQALKDYITRSFGWKEGQPNEAIKNQVIFGRTSLVKRERDQNNPNSKLRKKDSELRCTPQFIAESVLVNSLKLHIRKIPELNQLNENGRHMIHFHAFRKFFRTTVGDAVGRDYAEALMGHHFYLDTYYNLPEEKRREMYLKAEPYLTISDYTRVEKNMDDLAQRCREIEEKYVSFKRYMQTVGKDLPPLVLENPRV